MFTWLKVLIRLSHEEDILKEHEERVNALQTQVLTLEEKVGRIQTQIDTEKEDVGQLRAEIQKSLDTLNENGEKYEACTKQAEVKIQELRDTAEKYAGELSATVVGYEDKLAKFHSQVMEIKQAVVDFQR